MDKELKSIKFPGLPDTYRILKELPTTPANNGAYRLALSVVNGTPTMSWLPQATPPETWAEIQAAVRNGTIQYYVSPGDQVKVNISFVDKDFDVLGINEDAPYDPNLSNVLSIQAHNILAYGTIPFDPPQYLFAVTAEACTFFGWNPAVGMPAGTYNITLIHGANNGGTAEDGTFQFTTTQPIPVGGGIIHSYIGTYQSSASNYSKANVIAGTFSTYNSDTVATIETGLATTEGGGGTNLGTTTAFNPTYKSGDYINFTQCQKYGSSRWFTSFIRQYLNSDEETMTFTPQTIWSRRIATLPEGFLHTIDPELKSVLVKVKTRYARRITDGYGYDDVEDYVKLATMLDVFESQNNGISEGPVDSEGTVKRTAAYTYWQERATNADRIKYHGTTARLWWLGSSSPTYASSERIVNSSGALDGNVANSSRGLAPSLFIG